MLLLPNGCTSSEPSVFPKNWKSGGPSLLKKVWQIQYYFRDPKFSDQYKYGKLILIRGFHKYKTLEERRHAIKIMMENELMLLKEWHMNPITGTRVEPIEEIPNEFEIDPSTPFFAAIREVFSRLDFSVETKRDVKSVIKYSEMAAVKLRYDHLEISSVRRKHIKILLDQVGKLKFVNEKGTLTNLKWSANRFNVYRKYLHRLFEELIEMEATEVNPVKRIAKMKTVIRIRETLTLEERKKVNAHLHEKYYTFWRFCNIFFHSGGRETELLAIKRKDVQLDKQRYKTTIKKGKVFKEVYRTIKDVALPLWKELLETAKPDDYIFGDGLVPEKRPKPIGTKNVSRRWRDHVKTQLGITADMYSLKHSNLDETAAILDAKAASKMAGHTSTVITLEHYLGGEKEREHNRLKEVNNKF